MLVCQSGLAEFELFGQRGATGKLDRIVNLLYQVYISREAQ